MKKIILFISLIIIIMFYGNINSDDVVIPNESIRFRIIPNSNSILDISMKEKVKENINNRINLMSDTRNIEQARIELKNNTKEIENIVSDTFKENNYNKTFKVNYGYNYFPEKEYKGVKYESGEYESLVVEIGEAKGDNFWCVLFPPLCMMEEENTQDEKEYKFFVSEIISKYF